MRYHKVIAISEPDVACILRSPWVSLNPSPVMNLFDRWFDIRRMTENEVREFANDFMRSAAGEIRAGIAKPH
jgi:hypothetical protein